MKGPLLRFLYSPYRASPIAPGAFVSSPWPGCPRPSLGTVLMHPGLPPSLQKPWGQQVEVAGQVRALSVCVSLLSVAPDLLQDVPVQRWFVFMETGSSASPQT